MTEKKTIIKGMYNWTFLAIVIVAIILLNIISSFLNNVGTLQKINAIRCLKVQLISFQMKKVLKID